MRLFLVRHGETDWNLEGRFQGQRDTKLSEKGRGQARKVALYLARHKFDAVVSSPLSRAFDTALQIQSLRSPRGAVPEDIETIEGLTEINHGDWEGLLAGEVRERWGALLELWHSAPDMVRMPGRGGESLEEVRLRAGAGAGAIAAKYRGDVAVAAHDAVIKALLCHFLGIPLANFWRFQIANCSLSIVELNEGKAPRVCLMGDAHYLGEGFQQPEQKAL